MLKRKTIYPLLSVLVLIIIFLSVKLKLIENKIFIRNAAVSKASGYSSTLGEHLSNKTPFNILLLGYGGGNHDGAYLTDSMIVVHFDPANKKIVLVSIPRDIWVTIPTNGDSGSHWKINAAYELGLDDNDYPNKLPQFTGSAGGGNMVKYVVSQVTGLNIDRFLALDFSGFTKTIDTLGGVDINVSPGFDDPEYPIEGKEDDLCGQPASALPDLEKISTISAVQAFPCRYEDLHFDPGIQHMDGERALKYVRSRHSLQDGTDFGRSRRQRNLLVSVKQRVITIGFITKIVPFVSSLQDDLKTDLSLDEVKSLVDYSNELNGYTISNIALTDQNVLKQDFSDDGQFILLPIQGTDKWDSIHSWIASSFDPNRANSAPIISVQNGSHVAGLAALAVNRLQDKDYNVLPPANANNQDQTKTSILVVGKNIDPKIIDDLKKEFQTDQVVFQETSDTGYDILVTIGEDYNLIQGKKLINE